MEIKIVLCTMDCCCFDLSVCINYDVCSDVSGPLFDLIVGIDESGLVWSLGG